MSLPLRSRVLLRGAVVTLKHHRVEVGIAAVALLLLGAWAVAIEYQLRALGLPSDCVANLLQGGPPDDNRCPVGQVAAWSSIVNFQAGPLMGIVSWVPLFVGLLAGVPIVARELETGTSQTAWSLYGSRSRWLGSQLVPVLLVLGAASIFLALVASVIEQHRIDWGEPARLYSDIGLHGIPALARTLAAFGIGLLAGASIGRSLPAFVVGLALALVVSAGVGWAGDQWLAAQPVVPLADGDAAHITRWIWLTPDGSFIEEAQARALVPADVAAQDVGNPQAGHSIVWLQDAGFTLVPAGVSHEAAAAWSPYYSAAFASVGMTSMLLATFIVSRRRPV